MLVFGEDEHDRKSIIILTAGLRPDLKHRLTARRDPILLVKGVGDLKTRKRRDLLAKAVEAENRVRGVLAAIVHEDCDDVEPAHLELSSSILHQYSSTGCIVIPATPAWELETWWFLWPDAAQAVVPSWRKPNKFKGRNVGLIPNAKEAYKKATSPSGNRSGIRHYRESDSPLLAAKIVELSLLERPTAASASYSDFANKIRKL